jgi:glycosyltransferase involved in cell wall biosynthesis
MDNQRLKASIIIPTYNRAKELDFVLRGLLDQDIDKSLFEIVVVDDNSSDEILLVIKKYYKLLNLVFVKKDDNINGCQVSECWD